MFVWLDGAATIIPGAAMYLGLAPTTLDPGGWVRAAMCHGLCKCAQCPEALCTALPGQPKGCAAQHSNSSSNSSSVAVLCFVVAATWPGHRVAAGLLPADAPGKGGHGWNR
jgi:hypothetical protein